MPSIVTHHLFAKDVYKNLQKNIQKKIDIDYLLLFSQSFDNFFYYKFLTPWKGIDIRNFGEEAQKKKTKLYFKNILEEIETKHLENHKDIMGYLYGSICHYILDSTCHPFIFYYTGISKYKKYRGLHEKMEVNIDAQMFKKKTNKELYKEKATYLLPLLTFKKELKNLLNEVFKKTFQKENIANIYEKSVKTGRFLIKYGVIDRTGLKKMIYKLKDYITPNSKRKYQYLSFHVTKYNKEYLNELHEKWINPADNTIISNESFEELYEKALKETITIINTIDTYLTFKKNKKEVLQKIKDNSYITGLPLNLPQDLKYFKF